MDIIYVNDLPGLHNKVDHCNLSGVYDDSDEDDNDDGVGGGNVEVFDKDEYIYDDDLNDFWNTTGMICIHVRSVSPYHVFV